MNRREFIKAGAAAAGAAALLDLSNEYAYAFSNSMPLQKFVQALPGLGGGGIPVATPNTTRYPGVDYYEIRAAQYVQQLHPSLTGGTKLWGYADVTDGKTPAFVHLGPVIVAERGKPVRVKFVNTLPPTHILPVDITIPGAETGQLQNRAAIHLHGGHVHWMSDGGPFHWVAPDGTTGPSVVKWLPDDLGVLTDDHWYPNDQSARLQWYHDHAVGITRLNAYAGLASAYVITDAAEQAVTSSYDTTGTVFTARSIPARQLPIIVQDKIFKNANPAFAAAYPQYETPVGDLWYPYLYEKARWKFQGNVKKGAPVPSAVPEFFGDTMLVNGLVYPTVTVEPTRYRLRVLNACNARFLTLRLVLENGATGEPVLNAAGLPTLGPALVQIGTEGGFLPAPVLLNGATPATTLLLAPAERADIIVDFTGVPAGTRFLMYNDAPAPFPVGAPTNDYFVGAPKNPVVTTPGFGPNTRTLMEFVVGALAGPPDPAPATLTIPSPDPPLPVPVGVTVPPTGAPVRDLSLNEDFDIYGRLIQRIGTNVPLYKGTFGRNYLDPATETPRVGTTEVWRVFNLTADTHPLHFHLANAQIISRQLFSLNSFGGVPVFTGPAVPPSPNEAGWKETVRMNPGECTTVIMRFDIPALPPGITTLPTSPRTGGYEYVWHCHILEHEEHDMMRPLVVLP